MLGLVVAVVVTFSAVWVYLDATEQRIGKQWSEGGLLNLSAGGWAAVTLGLWILGFPCYLAKRSSLIQKAKTSPVTVTGRSWKILLILLIGGYFIAVQAYKVLVDTHSFTASPGVASSLEPQTGASTDTSLARGFLVDENGLVTSITSDSFYTDGVELSFPENSRVIALVADNKFQPCWEGADACSPALALEKVDGHSLCRASNEELAKQIGQWVMICSSSVDTPMREKGDGYKSAEIIAAGQPWLLFFDLNSGEKSRFRFSARESTRHITGEALGAMSAKPVSNCDLLTQGEISTRAKCDSGNLSACREIAGFVASRMMEGCQANLHSSEAASASPVNRASSTSPIEASPAEPPEAASNEVLTVTGKWRYGDGTQRESEEGEWFCLELDRTSTTLSPLLRKFDGNVCVTNPERAMRQMSLVPSRYRKNCAYRAEGTATMELGELQQLPEDEMNSERLEASLVQVREHEITKPLAEEDCY